ncbi:hypothetical protein GQ607_000773 [Colletotrichum asianum]|uniref:Uncharacterized protein n=1 Tax=Colletotrichum asianum TaxID=702518 RepID=A0A8H3WUK6_9PEZI|nr:hypothetical protein GQ607_000773 [Colletotrichum asianum]
MVRQKAESDQGRVLGGGRFAVIEHVCCVAIAVLKWYMDTCDYEVKSGRAGCAAAALDRSAWGQAVGWLSREYHFPLLDMTDPDVVGMYESIVIDERTMTGGRRRTTVERPIAGCC